MLVNRRESIYNMILGNTYNIIMETQDDGQEVVIPEKVDFTDRIKKLLLSSAGNHYQINMIVLFLLTSLFSNIQIHSSKLFYMNPVFNCQGHEGKVFEETACKMLESCTLLNGETVTVELSLYCGQGAEGRVLIQSAAGIGCWVGILFAALISDRYGRKFCFVLAIVIMNIGNIIQYLGIIHNVPLMMAAAEILMAFSGKTVYVNFLILCTRFLERRYFEIVTIGWLVLGTGFAEIIVAILNQAFHSWRLLIWLYIAGTIVVTVLSYLLLHEDPIFYFDVHEYDRCKGVIRDVALQNGEESAAADLRLVEMDIIIQEKHRNIAAQVQQVDEFDITELLRFDIMLNALILSLVGCCYNMSMDSVDLSIQSFAMSYNLNLLVIGVFGVIGYLTALMIMRMQEKRKRGFLFSSVVCGIAGMMFLFSFCNENPLVEAVCISVLRLSLCWISNYFVRLKVDLFPEKYQGTMVGYIEFLANFGKIFCPFLTEVSVNHGLNAIFTINLLHIVLGTIPIIFLAEGQIRLAESGKTLEAGQEK